jgi:hypothetical protein
MEHFKEIVKKKTNPELQKIVYAFAEWSPEMLQAAQDELARRGALPDDLEQKKAKLIEEEDALLTEGRDASAMGIIAGWISVLGLLGIFIGYHYAFSKTTSIYTKKSYYKYNSSSRKNGKALFYVSMIAIGAIILYRLQS